MLYACSMHFISIYMLQVALVVPLARRFLLENHITHPGATCNLPQNWSFLHAFYMHYIGILFAFICMLYAVRRHCIMHGVGILQACYTHCICIA